MACFNMTAMRTSLPSVGVRTAVAPAQRCIAVMPSFSGLSTSARLSINREAGNVLTAVQNGAKWFAMRHGKRVPRLGRPADQRKALVRSLVTETLRHGKIKTTITRAKAIRKYVDKMITLAKAGTLHSRRQVLGFVYDKEVVKNLFDEAPKRYGDRTSGYCRVTREVRLRRGDAAQMAYIELV